jgi:hypothetical protein
MTLAIRFNWTYPLFVFTPDQPAWHATAFLYGSVFLAFAFLNPDFELYLMFILPVKIKWLALLTWLGYGATVLVGSWTDRLLVLASVVNFLLFFAREILDKFKTGRRRMAFQAKQFAVYVRGLPCNLMIHFSRSFSSSISAFSK